MLYEGEKSTIAKLSFSLSLVQISELDCNGELREVSLPDIIMI